MPGWSGGWAKGGYHSDERGRNGDNGRDTNEAAMRREVLFMFWVAYHDDARVFFFFSCFVFVILSPVPSGTTLPVAGFRAKAQDGWVGWMDGVDGWVDGNSMASLARAAQ